MKSAFAITSYANEDQLPDFFKPQLSSSVEEEESHRLQRAVARMRADTESQELSTELGVNTAVNKCVHPYVRLFVLGQIPLQGR